MNFIKRHVMKWLKRLFRRPINYLKHHYKKAFIAYVLGSLPISYLTTGLTTNLNLTDFNGITTTIVNSGVPNMLTAGLYEPIKNGSKDVLGSVSKSVGGLLNMDGLVTFGTNLKQDASSWFKQTSPTIKQDVIVPMNQTTKTFDFNTYPNYYQSLGKSGINTSEFPPVGQIQYGELDELGRTTIARGTIDYKLSMKNKGNSQSFSEDPSGYPQKNKRVSIPWLYGKSYKGWFYNRSHLIADSLGGESSKRNAVTGTRTQNVGGTDQQGGMRYSEIKVTDYLRKHKNVYCYYSAEPVYQGNEIVPRSVIVRFLTSDGKLDESVEVFNYANGWEINYMDGSFTEKL